MQPAELANFWHNKVLKKKRKKFWSISEEKKTKTKNYKKQ